jgi:hypothetical protein
MLARVSEYKIVKIPSSLEDIADSRTIEDLTANSGLDPFALFTNPQVPKGFEPLPQTSLGDGETAGNKIRRHTRHRAPPWRPSRHNLIARDGERLSRPVVGE